MTLKLPSFTCTSKKDAISGGMEAYDSTNDADSGPFVVLECSSSKVPEYNAAFDIDDGFSYPTVTMHAGDKVVMSMTCGTGGTSVSVEDATSDSGADASSSSPSSCNSNWFGNIGVTTSSSNPPLPAFKEMHFSGATEDSEPIGSFSPKAHNYDEGSGKVITADALTHGGSNFDTTQG